MGQDAIPAIGTNSKRHNGDVGVPAPHIEPGFKINFNDALKIDPSTPVDYNGGIFTKKHTLNGCYTKL